MSQAFIGATYIKTIALGQVNEYLTGTRDVAESPIRLTTRVRFNPNLIVVWVGGVMEVINSVTMLTIILVGAAFIREREHGTIKHLLVMALTPFEIMMAKIWANGLAVAACYLFAAASIGIFLGTLARPMPQFGLLVILSHPAAAALRRRLAAREHAAAGTEHHAGRADHLLRPPGAGHRLTGGGGLRRDLARSAGHDRRRRLLLHGCAAALPQGGAQTQV